MAGPIPIGLEVARSVPLRQAADIYHAEALVYYRRADGSKTGEAANMRSAIERFVRFAGPDMAIVRVNRHLIRDWMQAMASERLTRLYVNETMRKVKRWLRWAADKGHAPMSLVSELQLVRPLGIGRTPARETGQRTPATMEQITQVINSCEGMVRDVSKLCKLTASRPTEILSLTSAEIVISERGSYILKQHHKTAHKARQRIIPLSAGAMAILERYYTPLVPGLYLFPSSRKPGTHFTAGGLRKALAAACRQQNVPIFTPYDLRRRAARVARHSTGLGSAQALLGHANVSTTERYAPADLTTSETFGAAMAAASTLDSAEFIRPRLSPVTPPPWPSPTDVSREVRDVAPPGASA